ncbi:hypothetical protein D3C71_24830 [compost metagenome]
MLPLTPMPTPYANAEPVVLDADKRAVALKQLKDLLFGFSTLANQVDKQSTMDQQLTHSVLSVAEFRIVDIAKMAGIEIHTQAEIEDRHARLRQANGRIRELEAQLGQAVGPEHLAGGLKAFADKLKKWWRVEGFGHISEMDFSEWGNLRVKFSCHLHGAFRLLDSPTPVSDKDARANWLKGLRDRGFVIDEKGRYDADVVDCDASRSTLQKLLAERLPSSKIVSTENHWAKTCMELRTVTVYIYDLKDLENLPTFGEVEDV